MTRHALFVSSAVLVAGCCDQSVKARAFVGHKSPAECRELIDKNDAPTSIICPGDEVTICWQAAGKNVTGSKITVAPDPSNQSGAHGTVGALYLTPAESTSVTVAANSGDCASTTKKITVVKGKTPATFDATWSMRCDYIGYTLDPQFVSTNVQAVDVTAMWNPTITYTDANGNTSTRVCTTPPFLEGHHIQDNYGFKVDNPFITTTFNFPHTAVGDWRYLFKGTCPGDTLLCNTAAHLPFAMTLSCP